MTEHSLAFWILTVSGGIYWVTVCLLTYRVRYSEKPLLWNVLGFGIGTLALQTTYDWYHYLVGGGYVGLSLVSVGLGLLVSLCLLSAVMMLTPFLSLNKRNRELLAVIEERNIIIHNFHERIGNALRQVQVAMEVGKPASFIVEQVAELNGMLKVFLEDLKAGVLLGNKFEVALKTLVEDVSKESSLVVDIQVDSKAVENLSYDLGSELLHIVREAMRNCVEHSQAKKVWISVKKTESARILEIADKGKGFEIDLVGVQGRGLGSMVTRAKQINARLKVHSQPGKGTSVLIEIPFQDNPSKNIYHAQHTQKAGTVAQRIGAMK